MLSWRWYDEPNTLRLLLHLILTVNWCDGEWRGLTIKRGQRVCSYATLASELRLSEKNIRTAVAHLQRTGELAHTSTPQYGIFTISNYDKFQEVAPEETPDGHSDGTQAAPDGHLYKKVNNAIMQEPPIPPKEATQTTYESRFKDFWAAYPKKVGKGAAEKAFTHCKPDDSLLATMLLALELQKQSSQWKRDGFRYVPNPATWLNQRRWEDELERSGSEQSSMQRSGQSRPRLPDISDPDSYRVQTEGDLPSWAK